MKKIIGLLIMSIFLLSFTSALWTERAVYSNNDMTVEIKSWWGFFEWLGINQTVGKLTLKSHPNVKHINEVGIGKQVPMYYEFHDFKEFYENGLGKVKFIDLERGKEIQKDFKFVYLYKEIRERDVCLEWDERIKAQDDLKCLKWGKEKYTWTEWRDYNLKMIPKENITIGIQIDAKEGEYIDAIWDIGGKAISKHASWNSSLETGLVSWYKLDETSGTAVTDSHGSNNGTSNAGVTVNETGKINKSYLYGAVDTAEVDFGTSAFAFATGDDFSISMWVKPNISIDTTDRSLFSRQQGTSPFQGWNFAVRAQAESKRFQLENIGSTGTNAIFWDYDINAQNGNWLHIVLTYDGTSVGKLYINNVEQTIASESGSFTGTLNSVNAFLGNRNGLNQGFRGNFDEVAVYNRILNQGEVELLYNDFDGCTYQDCGSGLVVELISPFNETTITIPLIDFEVNVTEEDMTVANVTLIIDGDNTYNTTQSGDGSKVYTFAETGFANGNYTWTAIACEVNGTCFNGNETRAFEVALVESIAISINSPANNTYIRTATQLFNATIIPEQTTVHNVTLTFGGTNYTNSSLTETTSFTWLRTLGSISEGNYSWYVSSCGVADSDSRQICSSSNPRTLVIDLTSPTIEVNLISSIIYTLGDNVTLNYTITDTNLNTCWYQYAGSNNTFSCSTGINAQYNISSQTGHDTIIVYANDSAGNSATSLPLTFELDTIAPNITLNYPVLVNYSKVGDTLQLNFTATDVDNFASVWYSYIRSAEQLSPSLYPGDGGTDIYWNFTSESTSNVSGDLNIEHVFGSGAKIISVDGTSSVMTNPRDERYCVLSDLNTSNTGRFVSGVGKYFCVRDGDDNYYLAQISDDYKLKWFNLDVDLMEGAISGVYNVSNITLSTQKNVTIYANDTMGNLNITTFSWDYKVFENSRTHNDTSYVTSYETYSINITSTGVTAVNMIYGGLTYALSNLGSGIWSRSKDINEGLIGNNSIYFNFTYAGEIISSSTTYQNVSDIVFQICDANYTTSFLNISFKDEANLDILNASIPLATFEYYLGSGTETKEGLFVNVSNNYNYEFCASPSTQTFKVVPYVQYQSNLDYPQRVWNPTFQTYTNTTTNQILYLLSSSEGLMVTFQVLNVAGQSIEGAEVTAVRSISGSPVTVGQGTTGADGSVTLWLNPNFVHTFTFTKDGYEDYIFTIAPTQSSYTITFGQTSTTQEIYTRGIYYEINPINHSLVQNEVYNFTLELTSSYWTLDSYGFNLRLSNGTIVTGGSTIIEGTELLLSYNVTNFSKIYMDYWWVINGSYTNDTLSWNIYSSEYDSWSIKTFFTDLDSYIESGIFGIDDFGKYLILFIVIFLSMGILSYKYGITSPMSVIGLMFFIIFFFDVGVGIIPPLRIGTGTAIPHLLTFLIGLIFTIVIVKEVSK